MMMDHITWSKREKQIARKAFDDAYERECAAMGEKVREMANSIAEPDDIWALHSFLSKRRREIDKAYDYRYSVLITVFGLSMRTGWLTEDDLEGLSEDKISKIVVISEL